MGAQRKPAIAMLTLLGTAAVLFLSHATPSVSQEEDIGRPQARATQRALEREERRSMRLNPEARATARAVQQEKEHEDRQNFVQPVEVRGPVPLPVELRNPSALLAAGRPVGAACPGSQSCTLELAPAVREVLVVTAVWSATKIECDDLTTASPSNGMPIAPWWRCQRRLLIEGPGAGYAGFVMIK